MELFVDIQNTLIELGICGKTWKLLLSIQPELQSTWKEGLFFKWKTGRDITQKSHSRTCSNKWFWQIGAHRCTGYTSQILFFDKLCVGKIPLSYTRLWCCIVTKCGKVPGCDFKWREWNRSTFICWKGPAKIQIEWQDLKGDFGKCSSSSLIWVEVLFEEEWKRIFSFQKWKLVEIDPMERLKCHIQAGREPQKCSISS